jgi:DNA-binding protein YbaB
MQEMDEMEKLLKSMTQMKDGMESMQKDLASYVEKHSENGIHLEVQGDGIVRNLSFADGTSAKAIETAINNANAKVKDFITKKMNSITPPELRDNAAA